MTENLHKYEVYEFFWGSAVKEQKTGKWTNVFLRPGDVEINLVKLPFDVEVHENGIEFLEREPQKYYKLKKIFSTDSEKVLKMIPLKY